MSSTSNEFKLRMDAIAAIRKEAEKCRDSLSSDIKEIVSVISENPKLISKSRLRKAIASMRSHLKDFAHHNNRYLTASADALHIEINESADRLQQSGRDSLIEIGASCLITGMAWAALGYKAAMTIFTILMLIVFFLFVRTVFHKLRMLHLIQNSNYALIRCKLHSDNLVECGISLLIDYLQDLHLTVELSPDEINAVTTTTMTTTAEEQTKKS